MEPISIFTVSAITVGLVEVLKRTRGISNILDGRYEFAAIIISIVISLGAGLDIFSGIIAGLTSLGLYDTTTRGISEVKKMM